jgi:beta-lactamase class D
MRNILYLAILGLFVLSCSPNNVKQDKSLKKYFDQQNVDGCFALLNNGTGIFTVYNLPRYRDSSYLPASTFKIVNSLIGLQTGKIVNENMIIKWDGIKRAREEWNKDLTMAEAFRLSAVNYYQEVARRIGRDTMQLWLDSLHYGTTKIRSSIDSFWLDNSLKITPDEELGLVKRLYFHELPFFKSYQEVVKRLMIFETNSNYTLAYKTGWGFSEKGHSIGWMVGWIEENQHPYFFVLNLESPDLKMDMVSVRMKILKDILKQLGFLQGKM